MKMATLDESLDFTSESFDSLTVLNAPNVKLPDESAHVYNNLTEYDNAMKGKTRSSIKKLAKAQAAKDMSDLRKKRLAAMVSNKNEDETTAPPRRQKILRNIFTFMENKASKGPLGTLQKCVQERIRIKVWTRNYTYIRGICTGYVVAFDKHWNLALIDVDETFILRKKLKKAYLETAPESDFVSTDAELLKKIWNITEQNIGSEKDKEAGDDDVEDMVSNASRDIDDKGITLRNVCAKSGEERLKTMEEQSANKVKEKAELSCSDEGESDEELKKLDSQLTDLKKELASLSTKENVINCPESIEEEHSHHSDQMKGLGSWMQVEHEKNFINICSKCNKLSCKCHIPKCVVSECHVPAKCISSKRRTQIYQRHVNQIFLRGDNIAIIALMRC